MIPPAHHHSGELCTDPGCRHVDQQVRHVGPCPLDAQVPCPNIQARILSQVAARMGLARPLGGTFNQEQIFDKTSRSVTTREAHGPDELYPYGLLGVDDTPPCATCGDVGFIVPRTGLPPTPEEGRELCVVRCPDCLGKSVPA